MKKLTNKKGFTLVELLVVVAIIAILMLLAVPRFMDSTKGAKIRTFESNFRTIMSAANQYSGNNNGSYENIGAGDSTAAAATNDTDVLALIKTLKDKPKGAKYTLSATNIVAEFNLKEVGGGTTDKYELTYTFSTGAVGTKGADKLPKGITSSF